MAFNGVFGNLSSGKTVFCVKYCYDQWKSKGRNVISNIKLKFPYFYMDLDKMIHKTRTDPEIFRGSILFIDEVDLIVDARRSGSDLNFKFMLFIKWLGKLNCQFVYTSQLFTSQIDLRIRELCDYLYFCERVDLKKNYLDGARTVDQDILIKVIGFRKKYGGMVYKKKTGFVDPKPYFKLYDTFELIQFDRERYLKK